MAENPDAGAKRNLADPARESQASTQRGNVILPLAEHIAVLRERITALEDRVAELERRERDDRRP